MVVQPGPTRRPAELEAPELVDALAATTAVEMHNPTKADSQAGRDDSFAKIVPIALAVILFIVSVMNADSSTPSFR